MPAFDSQISQLVNDFVAQVSALARQAAMDALEGALSGTPSNGARGTRLASSKPMLKLANLPKGAKRPADQIDAIKVELLDHIKSNPGQRVEQINKALGTKTKDVALPLKMLIAEGAIRTEGERRGTAYFPGDGVAAASKRAKRG